MKNYTPKTPVGYTPIPIHKLDYARDVLKAELNKLSKVTGKKYKVKTFYVGPRYNYGKTSGRCNSISGTTRRDCAVWAKLAVYTVWTWPAGREFDNLTHYV